MDETPLETLLPGAAIAPLPPELEAVETPALLVDVDRMDANLRDWQARCDRLQLDNRPHIKTHKSVAIARRQLALGARGITCQKLGEAEVMAAAGLRDILITYNILGAAKIARLARLAAVAEMRVTVDSPEAVASVGEAARRAERSIGVLVECDTGGGRCGVVSPEAAAALGARIVETAGLSFLGLMTYPAPGRRTETAAWLAEATAQCTAQGLSVAVVSSGGSPDLTSDDGLDGITEYRAGTNVFQDRNQMSHGAATLADCALSVLATVVSRPTPTRAVLDAGSKTLTTDRPGPEGYGLIPELPGARIRTLSEEHAVVDLDPSEPAPAVGARLRVVPNHVCVTVNLVDDLVLVRGDRVLGALPVDARGRSR